MNKANGHKESYTGLTYATDVFQIDSEKLYDETEIPIDLYIQSDKYFTLYITKKSLLTKSRIDRIKYNDMSLYVLKKDKVHFNDYVADNIALVLNRDDLEVETKVKHLHTATQNVVEDVFDNPRSGENNERTRKIVSHTIDYLYKEQNAYLGLMKIQRNDNYTFTHSVNVGTFLIALARELGISDKTKLTDIGQGGILHDLGKSEISASIINKPSKLDGGEWAKMKMHPQVGVDIAKGYGNISDSGLLIIGQHHENFEGNGYPYGLKGSMLSVYSNMAQIIDIYDAITTKRSYSPAETPYNAAKFLLGRKKMFNEKILYTFLEMIGVGDIFIPSYDINPGATSF